MMHLDLKYGWEDIIKNYEKNNNFVFSKIIFILFLSKYFKGLFMFIGDNILIKTPNSYM